MPSVQRFVRTWRREPRFREGVILLVVFGVLLMWLIFRLAYIVPAEAF